MRNEYIKPQTDIVELCMEDSLLDIASITSESKGNISTAEGWTQLSKKNDMSFDEWDEEE